MMEQESKKCQVAATTLKEISKLGYVILITTPIIFILIRNQNLNVFENVALLLFLITVIAIGCRAWHLYFDSNLLKKLSEEKFDLSDLDESLYNIFHKKTQNKTLEDRISSCYKLARSFFLFLIVHLLLFFGIIVSNLF